MKVRSFNLSEEQWELIREMAFQENVTCSEVIRRSIKDYLGDKGV